MYPYLRQPRLIKHASRGGLPPRRLGRHLALWLRNDATAGDKRVQIVVFFRDSLLTPRMIRFVTGSGTDGYSGDCVTDYIGTNYNDGEWHYLEFDLHERVQTITGLTYSLARVDGVMIRAEDAYVDDIVLSGRKLKKTYMQTGNPLGGTPALLSVSPPSRRQPGNGAWHAGLGFARLKGGSVGARARSPSGRQDRSLG